MKNILSTCLSCIALSLALSAFQQNARCEASSEALTTLTPEVIKALAPAQPYAIGISGKAACVIASDHSAAFVIPNNPNTTHFVQKRNDVWLLTTGNSIHHQAFAAAKPCGIDRNGHDCFELYDSKGNPTGAISFYIDHSGIQYVTWR